MKPATRAGITLSVLLALPRAGEAQHEHPPQPASQKKGAEHAQQNHSEGIPEQHQAGHAGQGEHAMSGALGPYQATREASGTSWVPESSPMHGFHREVGSWHGMVHGLATLVWDDQGGRRGDEELISTNMLMGSISRKLGPGSITLRSMLSLEPATVGDDGYPLLFQTGETEDGKTPLIDAQHPHDLFMELATIYSIPLATDSSVFAYVGIPGEPALGPPTFMHRFSAMEIPEAPLSHHWLDSTHISYGVVTIGGTSGPFKLDASVFNGREPDEHRWDIETDSLDSFSGRLSFNPTENWAFQLSVGDLHEPEQLEPDVDIVRSTASAIYNHRFGEDNWQTTFAVGHNDEDPGDSSDAFLLESTLTTGRVNTWLARVERVDKDELFTTGPLVGEEFTIDKLSVGYEREIAMIGNFSLAAGVLGSLYWFDSALDSSYGDDPRSFMVFLRGRL